MAVLRVGGKETIRSQMTAPLCLVLRIHFLPIVRGVGQDSVVGKATSKESTVRGSNAGGGEIFLTGPDRP